MEGGWEWACQWTSEHSLCSVSTSTGWLPGFHTFHLASFSLSPLLYPQFNFFHAITILAPYHYSQAGFHEFLVKCETMDLDSAARGAGLPAAQRESLRQKAIPKDKLLSKPLSEVSRRVREGRGSDSHGREGRKEGLAHAHTPPACFSPLLCPGWGVAHETERVNPSFVWIPVGYPTTLTPHLSRLARPRLGQIVAHETERVTPSYVKIPVGYPKLACSGRTPLGGETLNDVFVNVITGSEDYSFKLMRKNQYEEALFRCVCLGGGWEV